MNDHTPFIAAIIADPDNDLPRLIYADFLRENGQWDRAEFIAVQCELARMNDPHAIGICAACGAKGKPPSLAHYGCLVCGQTDGREYADKYDQLRRRERELLNARESVAYNSNWMKWGREAVGVPCHCSNLGGMQNPDLPQVTFHRGFVEEITCSWSDWQRQADAIRAATPLRKVRLTTEPFILRAATIPVLTSLAELYPGVEFEFAHDFNWWGHSVAHINYDPSKPITLENHPNRR